MKQPFILITDDNKKQITYDKKHKHEFICPVTGESYKTRSKKKGGFWHYIKASNLDPDNMDCNRKTKISNEKNIAKLFTKKDLKYLWESYFMKEYKLKSLKGEGSLKALKDLLGLINLELYIILIKAYKEKMSEEECMDYISKINVVAVSEEKTPGKYLTGQFSELSISLTRELNKTTKKSNGIYFTPLNIISLTLHSVMKYSNSNNIKINSILEPSCGSCEFINYMNTIFKGIFIDGIEYNKHIYKCIKDLEFNSNRVKLYNMDYLESNDKKYDLIIGNPPYFVMKKENVNKDYYKYFEGRPNIFVIFILHSLTKLKDNGILSFVLPKSFCNCTYYNNLREYIYKEYHIVDILDCSDEGYLETEQETIILTIANIKSNNNAKFSLKRSNILILNTPETITKLKQLYENTTTIRDLDMYVKVGNTVWNQEKDKLTDDDNYTRLIYSGDIYDNKLVLTKYKNEEKRNYINIDGENGPLLIVNRGYGVGEYSFNYCLVDIKEPYTIENHLITVRSKKDLSSVELLKKYDLIIKSFKNEKTKEFVKIYCCNSAMNTNELQNILPIYK